ncbi:hypothetical protein [Pyramidobacter sp.]|uniref:hypothetical protein n=1 Tax=Pyramidobacter sp. TaxID=1943581 RepID=UPI0033191502
MLAPFRAHGVFPEEPHATGEGTAFAGGGTQAYRDRIATQKERGLYTHIGNFSDFQARIEKNSSFTVEE